MGVTLTRSSGQDDTLRVTTLKTMQLAKETQWELRLVKLICSFNQVLLVYCCLQSLLGFLSDCLTGQVEALQYEEEDWEDWELPTLQVSCPASRPPSSGPSSPSTAGRR